jgi:hypothetical protein
MKAGERPASRQSASSGRVRIRLTSNAAGLFLLALGLSGAIGGLTVVLRAEDHIARDSKLTTSQRRHAATHSLGFDEEQFDAFRAELRSRQRYAVDVPERALGRPSMVGEILRAYSAFYFLPAIQEPQAKSVFHYRFR